MFNLPLSHMLCVHRWCEIRVRECSEVYLVLTISTNTAKTAEMSQYPRARLCYSANEPPPGVSAPQGGLSHQSASISSAALTLHFPVTHLHTHASKYTLDDDKIIGLSKYLCSWRCRGGGGLTYVVFMVDDRVERHILALEVSLSRLHVVSAVVALNETLKLTIHNGAVCEGTFLAWKPKMVN